MTKPVPKTTFVACNMHRHRFVATLTNHVGQLLDAANKSIKSCQHLHLVGRVHIFMLNQTADNHLPPLWGCRKEGGAATVRQKQDA